MNHPHIVHAHDFGSITIGSQRQPYLLMEYVDGVNLRQAMQSGSLTCSEALSIIPRLCDALQYAYEHDVLHRDIKPWLSDTAAHGDQLQAAAALDISETAVRVQVHRMRKRYRELVEAEVSQTLIPGISLQEEMRDLFAVLAGR